MNYPRYSYPASIIPHVAANVILGGRRSFRADGQMCIRRLQPPLRIFGGEHVPQAGPCLITFNHYYRPGFAAWWAALAMAASIPVDVHFVMTGELTFSDKWYAPLGQAGSRWLLKRLARTYGFTTMPPMPPRRREVAARARSIRRVLAFARQNPEAILGLAPEGGDQPGGRLHWPPKGAGRFIGLLAGRGFPIAPLGVHEENGTLTLNFGEMYNLRIPDRPSVDEKDRLVAETVMKAIARQLPPRLRGEFR